MTTRTCLPAPLARPESGESELAGATLLALGVGVALDDSGTGVGVGVGEVAVRLGEGELVGSGLEVQAPSTSAEASTPRSVRMRRLFIV